MVKVLYRRQRRLTYEDRCNIIHQRYGSLLHSVKRIRTAREVSMALAIKLKTVEYFCLKFESEGSTAFFNKKRLGVLAGTRPLTNNFENDQWLLREEVLKKWSHLTMLQRTAKINKLFNVNRAKSMVYNYFKAHNVVYR